MEKTDYLQINYTRHSTITGLFRCIIYLSNVMRTPEHPIGEFTTYYIQYTRISLKVYYYNNATSTIK